MKQLDDLKPFHLEDYLRTGDEVSAYLKIVLEEDDASAFIQALREVSRAYGFAEFAAKLERLPDELGAALCAPSVDSMLMLELAAALGWRLAPIEREERAEAA